jgi:diguanylate cyclase (GGDEF)-like protein/PAS domain S-box-containing protein
MEPNLFYNQTDTSKNIRILLIEDNQEDSMLIGELLGLSRRFFFQLDSATSLAEGLEKLKAAPHQMILSDLTLPDSSGIETVRKIIKSAGGEAIVLLTNLDDEQLALQAIREGAQDYLVKTELSGALLARSISYAIERKRAEEALRESRERYILAVEGSYDGIWDWNLKTNQIFFSPRWKRMLGFQDYEIKNKPEEWLLRIHPEDLSEVRLALASHIQGHTEHFESEYRIAHKDGTFHWALARGLAVRDLTGKAYRMAGSQTDTTSRKQAEQQLQFDAFHDALTGLPNRALFFDRLERAIQYAKRRKDYLYAVLFLDLDRFKVINDSLGHTLGDQLLILSSRKLESCLRAVDTVSRFGGDEFVVLIEDIKEDNDALEVAERIREEFRKPIDLNSHKVVISASIGIVLSRLGYHYGEDILRDADIAMYHAKMHGKECHVIFEASMRQRIISRLEMENDLRQAIENKELTVHYQPIISLRTWKITGFEALVRWKHPKRGQIPPKEFIPIAEETGMIHPLGLIVLSEACRQMRKWQIEFPIDPPLTMSVNVSGKQIGQPDFVEKVEQVIQETGLDPHFLSFEITESLFVENDEKFNQTLDRLCKLGISLQIDDFGTGYSSFAYLQRIPVSSIKIDSTFINHMQDNNNHAQIVRSIVTLAHSLGMEAIAEGVESAGQLTQLKTLDCSFGQGFYISRPITGELGDEMLRRSHGTGKLLMPVRNIF